MHPAESAPALPEPPPIGTAGVVVPATVPAPGERRFNLGDGMILVAATAVALGFGRLVRREDSGPIPGWITVVVAFVGGAIAGTPALLVLRLRRPRPPLHELARQPGFAASLAGTATLGLGVLASLVIVVARAIVTGLNDRPVPLKPLSPDWWGAGLVFFAPSVGPAVIAVWLLLAVSGQRRPARGWLDPLARALGVGWIILLVVNCGLRLAFLVD